MSADQQSGDTALVKLDVAQHALAECKTVMEAKQIADAAEAARVYLERTNASVETVNRATEIRLLAERQMGAFLKAMPKNPGGNPELTPERKEGVAPKLSDIGITYQQSSRSQKLASIPADEFHDRIAVAKIGGKLSTAKVLEPCASADPLIMNTNLVKPAAANRHTSASLIRRMVVAGAVLSAAVCCPAETDYLERLSRDAKLNEALGLEKLTDAEKAAWNRIIAAAFNAGIEAGGRKPVVHTTDARIASADAWDGTAWATWAKHEGEGIITLSNGGVFEAPGCIALAVQCEALLLKDDASGQTSIWMSAGLREWPGEIKKIGIIGQPLRFRRSRLLANSNDGSIFRTSAGHVFEVEVGARPAVRLWGMTCEIIELSDDSVAMVSGVLGKRINATRLK